MTNTLNDTGNPADASENLGNLEQGIDLLAVRGTWVYDSAHEGWNEIHPIKHCQRIGRWEGSWEKAFDAIRGISPTGTIQAGKDSASKRLALHYMGGSFVFADDIPATDREILLQRNLIHTRSIPENRPVQPS